MQTSEGRVVGLSKSREPKSGLIEKRCDPNSLEIDLERCTVIFPKPSDPEELICFLLLEGKHPSPFLKAFEETSNKSFKDTEASFSEYAT